MRDCLVMKNCHATTRLLDREGFENAVIDLIPGAMKINRRVNEILCEEDNFTTTMASEKAFKEEMRELILG